MLTSRRRISPSRLQCTPQVRSSCSSSGKPSTFWARNGPQGSHPLSLHPYADRNSDPHFSQLRFSTFPDDRCRLRGSNYRPSRPAATCAALGRSRSCNGELLTERPFGSFGWRMTTDGQRTRIQTPQKNITLSSFRSQMSKSVNTKQVIKIGIAIVSEIVTNFCESHCGSRLDVWEVPR